MATQLWSHITLAIEGDMFSETLGLTRAIWCNTPEDIHQGQPVTNIPDKPMLGLDDLHANNMHPCTWAEIYHGSAMNKSHSGALGCDSLHPPM
jgi:hypothetical protein